MAWHEHKHAHAHALAIALSDALADAVRDALQARGHAWLALAGGRTPLPAYVLLAAANLDWHRVTVMPTDERCVPHAHPDCNARALHEAFAAAPGVVIDTLTVADGDAARSLAHSRATTNASMRWCWGWAPTPTPPRCFRGPPDWPPRWIRAARKMRSTSCPIRCRRKRRSTGSA